MMAERSDNQGGSADLSEGARSFISLIVLIHLFCAVTALLGNESISELRNRLSFVLGPYTRLLNLDPGFTAGLHLTHAMEYEDDHQLVVESPGAASPEIFPGPRSRTRWLPGGFRDQHWRLLAKRVGILASEENDDAVAELARAIGESYRQGDGLRPMTFQIRRVRPTELDANVAYDLDDPAAYETFYRADVFTDSQGAVRIHKKIDSDEAAPVVTE